MKKFIFRFGIMSLFFMPFLAQASNIFTTSPTSLTLQTRLDGSCQPVDTQSIEVTNNSTNKISLNQITLSDNLNDVATWVITPEVGKELRSGEKATITITFAPKGMGTDKIDIPGNVTIQGSELGGKGADHQEVIPIQAVGRTAGNIKMTLVYRGQISQIQDAQTIDIGKYNPLKANAPRLEIQAKNQGTAELAYQKIAILSQEGKPDLSLPFQLVSEPPKPRDPLAGGSEDSFFVTFNPATTDKEGLYQESFSLETKDELCNQVLKQTLLLKGTKTDEQIAWNLLAQQDALSPVGIVSAQEQMPEDIRGKANAWLQIKVPVDGKAIAKIQLEALIPVTNLQATWNDTTSPNGVFTHDHDYVSLEVDGFLTRPIQITFDPSLAANRGMTNYRSIMQVSYIATMNGMPVQKTANLYIDGVVTGNTLNSDEDPELKGGIDCSAAKHPTPVGLGTVLATGLIAISGWLLSRRLQKPITKTQ